MKKKHLYSVCIIFFLGMADLSFGDHSEDVADSPEQTADQHETVIPAQEEKTFSVFKESIDKAKGAKKEADAQTKQLNDTLKDME